jgi:hypothetical protein
VDWTAVANRRLAPPIVPILVRSIPALAGTERGKREREREREREKERERERVCVSVTVCLQVYVIRWAATQGLG